MSNKTKNPVTAKIKNGASRLGLRALEPRVLLDAAGFVTGADVAVDALQTQDVAEEMTALFDNEKSAVAPAEEITRVDKLLSSITEAEALAERESETQIIEEERKENQAKEFGPPIYDQGGKEFTIKEIATPVTEQNAKELSAKEEAAPSLDQSVKELEIKENIVPVIDQGSKEFVAKDIVNPVLEQEVKVPTIKETNALSLEQGSKEIAVKEVLTPVLNLDAKETVVTDVTTPIREQDAKEIDGKEGTVTTTSTVGIVFVDQSVKNWEALVKSVPKGFETVLVSADADGLKIMRETLAERKGVTEIHIFSKAETKRLNLGRTVITAESIRGEHAEAFKSISSALSAEADILVYGSNFGANELGIKALANATGADIAASNNKTGATALGGDWDLEIKTGDVKAAVLTVSGFEGVLDTSENSSAAPTIDLDYIGATAPSPGLNGFTELSFSRPTETGFDGQTEEENNGVGEYARYANVGTVVDANGNDVEIDFVATVVRQVVDTKEFSSVVASDGNENPIFNTNGPEDNNDNANVLLSGDKNTGVDGRATFEVRWTAVISGTDTPVIGNFAFVVSDLDQAGNKINNFEEVIVNTNSLDGFVIGETDGGASGDAGSDIEVLDVEGNVIFQADDDVSTFNPPEFIRFNPVDSDPGRPGVRPDNSVQLNFTNTSTFTLIYNRQVTGANISLDGNFSTPFFGDPVIVDTNSNFANIFTEGNAPIHIAAQTADVNDLAQGDIRSLEIEPGNIQDGEAETLIFNGDKGTQISLALDGSDRSQQSLSVGGTQVAIQFDVKSGSIVITEQTGGVIPQDDLEGLLRSVTYENTSTTPTEGSDSDRTLTFRVTDNDGLVSNDAVSTIKVLGVSAVDTDGDGVADFEDIDDDNDGILDEHERGESVRVQGQLQFNHNGDEGRDTGPSFIEYGGTPAVSDVIASGEETVIGSGLTVLMTGEGTDNASLYEFDLDGANALNFEEAVAADDFVEMSFTTTDANVRLSYLFHSFSAEDAGGSNRGDYRVTYLISDDGFETSDALVEDFQFQSGDSGSFNGQFPSFDGYQLDPNTRYSVRVYVYDAQNSPAGQITFNDQTFEFEQVMDIDTDGDGIANHLDIDSDNDGITDNIEAQSTAGYIAPNADDAETYQSNSGLNSAYVLTNGLTAVNTDGIDEVDYLDTNSDNEGGSDTAEAGLSGEATGLSNADTDADGDGLFDVFETQNGTTTTDGFNVNEGLNTGALAYPDSDSDAVSGTPLTADVDFRDVPPPQAQDDVFALAEDPIAETEEIGSITNGNLLVDNGNGTDNDPNSGSLSITQINGEDIKNGQVIKLGSGALLTIRTDGTFDYNPNGAFESLGEGETARETFTYTLSENRLSQTDIATVTLTISGDNDAPVVIRELTEQTSEDGVELTPFDVSMTFDDVDNETLTYSSSNLPKWMSINSETGIITGTPPIDASQGGPDNDGLYMISVTATDEHGATVTTTVVYNISNPVPIVDTPVGVQAGIDGVALSIPTMFSDPDGDILSYTATGLPEGVSIDSETGEISGTPTRSASQGGPEGNGIYSIAVTADDGEGGTVTDTFSLRISNLAPSAENDDVAGSESASSDAFNVFDENGIDVDSDPDADVFTITRVLSGNNEAGLDSVSDGTNVGQPIAGSSGGIFTINSDGTASFDANGEFDDLAVGEIRVTEIVYQIDDGDGGTDTAVVTYTVSGENDLITPILPGETNPPSDPQNYIPAQSGIDSGEIVSLDLSPYFSDADTNDIVSLSINPADLPAGLTFDGTSISGTLDANASQGGDKGVYTVLVTATDGQGSTFTTNVTYMITNPTPVVDMTVEPREGFDAQPITIETMISDPDGDRLTYTADGLPDGLTINPETGVISGTPDNSASQGGPNKDGVYVVTVTADDGEGGTIADEFDLTIKNPAPIAQDDVLTVAEDTALLTGSVYADNGNGLDSDPDADDLTVIEVGEAASNVGEPIAGSDGGVFTISSDGSYSFDPNGDFEDLAVHETAVSSITYLISDGEGGTDLATVTVMIDGVNDRPIPVDPTQPNAPIDPNNYIPAQIGVDSEQFTPLDLTSYFDDPDGSDELVLSIAPSDLPEGLIFDPSTGILSGTPSADASQGGMDGVYDVQVTAKDPSGAIFTTQVQITISNLPPEAFDDIEITDEDSVLSDSVLSDNGNTADYDPDGDTLTVTEVNGMPISSGDMITLPSGAILTMNDDGSYDYDPNGQFENLAAGEVESDSFTYQITDGQGGVSDAVVSLTIEGANDAPVPVDPTSDRAPIDPENYIPAQIGEDGTAVTPFDLTPYFGDPDGIDVLTLTIDPSDLPEGLEFDGTRLTGTLGSNASQGGVEGVYEIPVTATDPNDEAVTTIVTYTVTNPVPFAENDSYTTSEDTPITVNIIDTNDLDPDGDVLVVDAAALPDGTVLPVGEAVEIPQGMLTLMADGTVTLDPHPDTFGSVIFGYTISDGQGGTDVATVTIDVTPVNDTPVVTPSTPAEPALPPQSHFDGDDVSVPTSDPFSDVDDDPLSFVASGLPEGLTIDPQTGVITGTLPHDASAEGPYDVIVTATDPDGENVSTAFVWTVENIVPEVVTPLPTVETHDGAEISVSTAPNFIDPDGDDVTYSVAGLPEGLSIDPQTGVISGVVDGSASQDGPYDVRVTATDAQGDSVDTNFALSVDNLAPVIGTPIMPSSILVGEDVSINLGAVTQDPDSDAVLTYSSDDLPPGLLIDPETGIISGIATAPSDTPYSFTVKVTDGEGGVTELVLDLQINEDGYIGPEEITEAEDEDEPTYLIDQSDAYAFAQNLPFDVQRYFYDRALEARDEFGRMFGDRDFLGGMVTANPNGLGGDNAYMVVEAMIYEHHTLVSMGSTLSLFEGVSVSGWDISMADGSEMPSWMDWAKGSDFINIANPLDTGTIRLQVTALLDNGRTGTMVVEIGLRDGKVEQIGDAYTQGQTLQQQLALESQALREQEAEANRPQDALLKSLAG